ncbi:unnamed protein product [Kluyveromyces dobzhanskii CBS 2104]|uniref:WGS project CCBQ000000000 data, contig 00058 n=1 Tax=Kluyveromyces dobzhanskii CBS 2104 TaxID=1427455 RepID=A0A0A8LBL7_9SACH|nr:unnamed protein product [Kluyveromyces dobzhanskii CBS 2104]
MEANNDNVSGSLIDMDLEGLDFETAYQLINEKADLWDDPSDQFHMNLVDDSHFFNNLTTPQGATPLAQEHDSAVEKDDKDENHGIAVSEAKQMRQMAPQLGYSGPSTRPHTPKNRTGSPVGGFAEHTEGLLSVNESHAIEHFLDSLLTASPTKASNFTPFSPKTADNILKHTEDLGTDSHSYIFDTAELQTTIARHFTDKRTSKEESKLRTETQLNGPTPSQNGSHDMEIKPDVNSAIGRETKTLEVESIAFPDFKSCEFYEPIDPKIPVVEVPEDVIPTDIQDNAAELRRWKHVYLEKQRRNTFKREYDELVGLINYPRPAWPNVNKMLPKSKEIISLDYKLPKKEGKRITKHTLLNYIVQDIQLLLLANEELEQLCS